MKILKYIVIATLLIGFQSNKLYAANEESADGHEEGFNAVNFIFEHVNDSHEWFFFSVGDKHVTIPLPVIVYSTHSGWHFFSSNKFHHHEEGFNFYVGATGSENEGKIVEKLENGSEFIPLDLSITKTVLGLMLISLLIIIVAIKSAKKTAKSPHSVPKGIQNIVEPLVNFVRDDIAKDAIGKHYKRYLPYLLTVFTFILVASLISLILPLGMNLTGNIAVTFVLAAITFIITTVSGNKHYWAHIVNPPSPWYMKFPIPLMPLIEFMGIFIKPIVLMIRLFANMLAGHMIVSVLVALIFLMSYVISPVAGFGTSFMSIAFSVFMVLVDILVSFIQAYIFTLLSAMYFGMATDDGH